MKMVKVSKFEEKFIVTKWFGYTSRFLIGLTCVFSIYVTSQMIAANASFFYLSGNLSQSAAGKTESLNWLIEELNKTSELYPYESRYLVELSRVHGRRFLVNKEPRELEKALEVSKKSEAHAWEQDKIYIFQFRILMELKRTLEAIEVAEKAIYFSPSNLEMRLKVSELYLQRGLGDSALPHLLYATKIKENDFGAYQMLAQYYISKKNKIAATEYAQKILHYYPELTESVVRELFKLINEIL
jgi:tetratricopeptide (TPR) repeat protein